MRCRSWVIITPPKRDDPIYASERFTVFLPQSGFVQQAITLRTPIVSAIAIYQQQTVCLCTLPKQNLAEKAAS
jgi:hypothetical protein